MSSDDRFDDALDNALRAYNEPPPVPRDAMWEQIEAARRPVTVIPVHRSRWRPFAWGTAAAALLAVGIGIGRWLDHGPTPAPGPTAATGPAVAAAPNTAYRLAALDHFTRAEVLLTRVGATGPEAEAPAAIGPWARDLLQDTRLLLDSPAGSDAQLRGLLSDLELVLVQIVQAQAQRQPQEREWIADGVQQQGLLDRLRLVTPNSPVRTGNSGV
jgi:hypothetical protein